MFVYFSGFNGFHQFGTAHDNIVRKTTELSLQDDTGISFNLSQYKLISCSWSFIVLIKQNKLILNGFVKGRPGNCVCIRADDPIKNVASNDDTCLVLLETGTLYKLKTLDGCLKKLQFEVKEKPSRKRSIFGQPLLESIDIVEHIAIGTTIAVATTKNNLIYNTNVVPCLIIYELQKHEKIISLCCGFEHALALTGNGDLYTWGCGLRGQLGCDIVRDRQNPELLEALAGIKIISISAAGWHSVAVSAFGDIYTWGFNISGQLGIRLFRTGPSNLLQKNPSVYPFPQLMDLPRCCNRNSCGISGEILCNDGQNHDDESMAVDINSSIKFEDCAAVRVYCGSRHTIVERSCGKLFGAGWNKFGQLGINDKEKSCIDSFQEVYATISNDISNVICGPWCTIVFAENTNN